MTKQFKNIVKKIYKCKLFHSIEISKTYIGFKNVNNVLFTFQIENQRDKIGYFTAGYVREWIERAPTFESEYNTIGDVKRAKHDIIYIQKTDNPDFILRQAKYITLN